jgi:hypothetical protein
MKPFGLKLIVCYITTATILFGQAVLQDTFSYAVPAQNTYASDLGGGVFGYEIDTTGFSAAGHDKLVLTYSTKDEDGGDIGGALFTSIFFNGVSLTEAVSEKNFNRGTAGVWYLDEVASDGIIRLEIEPTANFDDVSEFAFGLYALDGLKAGVQDTAFGNADADATVSLTTNSGFLVQEAVRNNQSLTASGTDDYTTLYSESIQSYRALQQYQVATAAGDYFAPNGNTNTKLVMGAAFEAVPEPGSFALLAGMFGLTWVMLRRRS